MIRFIYPRLLRKNYNFEYLLRSRLYSKLVEKLQLDVVQQKNPLSGGFFCCSQSEPKEIIFPLRGANHLEMRSVACPHRSHSDELFRSPRYQTEMLRDDSDQAV